MKKLFVALFIVISTTSKGQHISATELIKIRYMKFEEAQKYVLSKGFKLIEKDTSIKGYTILMFRSIEINNSKKVFIRNFMIDKPPKGQVHQISYEIWENEAEADSISHELIKMGFTKEKSLFQANDERRYQFRKGEKLIGYTESEDSSEDIKVESYKFSINSIDYR